MESGNPTVQITTQDTLHNDLVSRESYFAFGENRSAYVQEMLGEELLKLMQGKASFRKIHQFVRKKVGVCVAACDR